MESRLEVIPGCYSINDEIHSTGTYQSVRGLVLLLSKQ